MEKYREFLSHARECEELAKSAATAEGRKEWEKLARTWRTLAGERQTMRKLPPDAENPAQ